jgi:RNA polymerase sigma factor (sigma-70 family)
LHALKLRPIRKKGRMNALVEQLLNELKEFAPELGNGSSADRKVEGRSLRELLALQDDAILVGALRAGVFRNEIVEELLVVRYRARLIRLLCTVGAEYHTAESLVQQLCADVLEGALDNFDASQEFGRYVQTMVRNLHRTSKRRKQPAFTEDMLESPGPDTVDQEVELREMLSRFEEAMHEFPELEQRIMRMTSEGWEPGEIADELGLEARQGVRTLNG